MKKIAAILFAFFILIAANNISNAASIYATKAGAGWFDVIYQVKPVWEWDEQQQQVVLTGTAVHMEQTVIQGPDQDWTSTADIHPGVISYDNFLGPSDRFTSGWGGAASGGSLILCFDTPFVDGEGHDILIDGFGYGFNIPFSEELGAVNVYVADASYDPAISDTDPHTGLVTIKGDETKWVKISGWEKAVNPDPGNELHGFGDLWVSGNPDFDYESFPGGYCDLFLCDLAGSGIDSASYIKFELGNGGMYWSEAKNGWDTTGRAIFIDSAKALYHRPIADAGADQHINIDVEVTLNASHSLDIDEGDEITCQWTQTAGEVVGLSDASAKKPTFTADTLGSRTFELTVSDGVFSDTDTVDIDITEPGSNQSPTADAGSDQQVNTGDTVSLNASGSLDPDGDALSYQWIQTGGPVVVFSDAESAQPTFTAPYTGLTLIFELSISDGELTDLDTVDIYVNRPPIADAGRTADEATEGLLFTLDASRSLDPDGDDLSYQWVQTGGPLVILSDDTAKKATFVTPELPGETLSFELIISDGNGMSDTKRVDMQIRKLYIIDTPIYATYAADGSVSRSLKTGELDIAKHALGAPDYMSGGDCSGWDNIRGFITLKFHMPIADANGEDLRIYSLGSGRTEISLSIDGEVWTSLGLLPDSGGSGLFYTSYDLRDYPLLGEGRILSIQYIRIEKTATEGKRYIDAVQGYHCALTKIHAMSVEDSHGCVDWTNKDVDGGKHALGAPDYDDSTPGIGNCSGWMVKAGYITLGFDMPFVDRIGDDLYIYHFGQGVTDEDIINGYTENATTVEVSEDGNSWISLGDLPLGTNRGTCLSCDSFDFSNFPELGEFDEAGEFRDIRIQHIRIKKNGQGYTAGKFIDAVTGAYGFPGAANPAGKDRIVVEGSAVVLGMQDEDAGNMVYQWIQVENGAKKVVLSADNVQCPTFIAPSCVDGDEFTLIFELSRINEDVFGVSLNTVNITVVKSGITEFPEANISFYNDLADQYMGISSENGDIVFYEIGDPDYKFSRHFIEDMNNRPKNLKYGMTYFNVRVPAEGDTAILVFYLPEPAPSDYRWFKYSKNSGWCDFTRTGDGDGAVFSSDRTKVTLYITDNGDYDDDERPCIISDPSGLGLPGAWHDHGGVSGFGGCFISTCAGDFEHLTKQPIE